MNLCQFLQSSSSCPVCGEPLITYMQELDGDLWKSRVIEPGLYHFDKFDLKTSKYGEKDRIAGALPEISNAFWIQTNGNEFDISFEDSSLIEFLKLQKVFFFNMCGVDCFKERYAGNYVINAYGACYYRSSAVLDFDVSDRSHIKLQKSPFEADDVRDEIFTFKLQREDGSEKVYILNLDFENKSTLFRYYSATAVQKKDMSFEPDYLEKDLPLLSVRPNFSIEDRSQLIDRMNGWILMS